MKITRFSLSNVQKYAFICGVVSFVSTAFVIAGISDQSEKNVDKGDAFNQSYAEKLRKKQDYENLESYMNLYLHGKQRSTKAYHWAANEAVKKQYDPCVFYNLWRNYIHGLEASTPSLEHSENILGWLIVFTILHMADVKCCVATNHVYRSCDKDSTKRFELMQQNYKYRFDYHKDKISVDYSTALSKAKEIFANVDFTKLPRPIWARYVVNNSLFSTWVSFKTPSEKSREFFSIKQVRQAINRLRKKVFNDMLTKLEACKNWDDFFKIKEADIKDEDLDVEYVLSDDEDAMSDCLYHQSECDDLINALTSKLKGIKLDDLNDDGNFDTLVAGAIKKINVKEIIKKIQDRKAKNTENVKKEDDKKQHEKK